MTIPRFFVHEAAATSSCPKIQNPYLSYLNAFIDSSLLKPSPFIKNTSALICPHQRPCPSDSYKLSLFFHAQTHTCQPSAPTLSSHRLWSLSLLYSLEFASRLVQYFLAQSALGVLL
ncbi:hypothetical protein ACTXT7_015045 [Hymenolepis weldensis]